MLCSPGGKCEGCQEPCHTYDLYLKDKFFGNVAQNGFYQPIPMDDAIKQWITTRKAGIRSYIVAVR